MKKRLLAVIAALAALVCVCLLPAVATENTFQAGYGQVNITPTEAGLPLGGYVDADRAYTEIQSQLYVNCIAMTDKYGTNALLVSVDTHNASQVWSNGAKDAIVAALGEAVIDIDRIYISATTTGSAPELVYSGVNAQVKAKVDDYRQKVITACADAAVAAMADRTPVTMYHNDMDVSEAIVHHKTAEGESVQDGDLVTRLNYNNHYNVVNKNNANEKYVASNSFGPAHLMNDGNYNVTEVAKPDDTMGLLVFQPEDNSKDPIVLANWSARANIASSGANRYGMVNYNKLSSDYVGFFRDAMAADNLRAVFFQGAAGNVSAFPMTVALRNPDVMQEDFPYEEEVNGETVSATAPSITPQLYGERLAELAKHGLEHEDGDSHLHAADMDAPINNMKIRFAVRPNVPTDLQVELVHMLKMSQFPMPAEDELDPGMGVYASPYEQLIDQWDTTKPQLVQVLTEADRPDLAETLNAMESPDVLTGIVARMSHTINAGNTNFATDAVYCDATLLQLGKMTFVMAPADLYDQYGQNGEDTWDSVGAHFVLGGTNGASGYLPNAASFEYNKDSDVYYTGTNITLSTIFPKGAGELLMEAYANVKKTMTATKAGEDGHDPENEIRMQCECGGLAEGKPGHICEIKEFLPWYDPDSLPVSGNYYLKTDVTLLREARTGTAEKCIDLNGHTITRKVLREVQLDQTGAEIPADHYYQSTRLFALEANARLTVTDSEGGGKLLRDISDLNAVSADEQKKITNYGLLVAIVEGNTSEFILYNGTMDATGQYSCGGACVANMSAEATFTMYGGQLTGGISDRGAALYANGTNKLYGGKITGGEVRDTADDGDTAEKNGNVNLAATGKLLLAGDTEISGGKMGSEDCNLVINDSNSLTVDENYTGSAAISVKVDDPNGTIIAWIENVPASVHGRFTVDNYDDYSVTLCNDRAVTIAQIRTYCICGGKAENAHDHECQDIQWKPWPSTYTSYLPNAEISGNYYLLTDISLTAQKRVASELHLDLNGYNITHVVDPAAEKWAENTRVFYVDAGGSLSITDSSNNPGTVTRDLSKLSQEQKDGIENYGIIVLMNSESTGDFVLFNGVLDAEGQKTGGGAVANLNQELAIRIYGGEIRGGVTTNGGCIYSQGDVKLHGGMLTGGESTRTNGAGGIYINETGHLYLCDKATVTGNTDAGDNPANIKVPSTEHFTVVGTYTGTAGIILNEKPYHNMPVAVSENANIDSANFTADNYQGLSFAVEGNRVVVKMDAAYITTKEGEVTYHKTLQNAFDAYAEKSDYATVTLQRDVEEEELSIGKDTFLNLTGFDVNNTASFEGNGKTLYVFDTQTDDYTVEDGKGYGIITGAVATAAQGVALDTELAGITGKLDHYLKITEGNETSFHRLNLRMAGITLNTDSMDDDTYWPGLFYNAQFGGDEVIKRNMEYYGVALNVKTAPEFKDRTYTKISADNWQSGTDANGNSLNVGDSMKLRGILKHTNTFSINSRNAGQKVFGQAYVHYNGANICGPVVSYSLRDVFEGAEGLTGVEGRWGELSDAERESVVKVFNTYSQLMRGWNIPTVLDAAGFVQPVPTLPNQTQPTETQPTDPLPEE